jgi:hypothetical protein
MLVLPDFPETKRLFARAFTNYMSRRIRQISPFGMIEHRRIFEGRRMRVTRSDDTSSESEMVQQSAVMEIKTADIETLTIDQVFEKISAMILEMASGQANTIRAHLAAEIPDSQSIDGRGRKVDAQMVIEMYEKIQVEFNPDGTPHEIFVDGPIWTPERLAAIEREFNENPELKKKFDEMMAKKKEEWLVRESDRKLVG